MRHLTLGLLSLFHLVGGVMVGTASRDLRTLGVGVQSMRMFAAYAAAKHVDAERRAARGGKMKRPEGFSETLRVLVYAGSTAASGASFRGFRVLSRVLRSHVTNSFGRKSMRFKYTSPVSSSRKSIRVIAALFIPNQTSSRAILKIVRSNTL